MLLALCLLPLALAPAPAGSPPVPAARPLTCAEAEEEYEADVGELSDRPLQIRICTAPQGDLQRVHIQTRWTPEGEADEVVQNLHDDVDVSPAGAYEASVVDDTLHLTWPSAGPLDPTGQTTTAIWRWNAQTHRFGDIDLHTTSPWAEGVLRVQDALARGDFAAARAEVMALGTTPNGGKTWEDNDRFLDFLSTALQVAHGRARLFDAKGAAAVVADILDNPPVTSHKAHPDPGDLVLCRGLASPCDAPGSFNALPASVDLANQLTAAAFYLAHGKRPDQALTLLRLVLGHYGATPELQLLYADTLWDADRRDEAAAAYEAYNAMQGAQPSRRAARRAGKAG